MSKTYQDKAITLKRIDIKEADRLFVFYTKEHGKVEAVARGVKKINSKMAGHLEPLGIVDLMIARGKSIDQVAGAARRQDYKSIKDNLLKVYIASCALETVEALTKPDHPDKKIYELLDKFLLLLDSYSLNGHNKIYPLLFVDVFVFKLLAILGFNISLQRCVKCKSRLKPRGNFFNARTGGVVCPKCNVNGDELVPISEEVIKVLRAALRKPLKFFLKLKAKDNVIIEVDKIISIYTEEHIERPINAKEVLNNFFQKQS